MNICSFTGNLATDAELKKTSTGKSVCSFRVAVRRPRNKDVTDYFTFTAWESQAENISKYFGKGDCIALNAYAVTREWENKEGAKQRAVEFTVLDFSFLNIKREKKDEHDDEGICPSNELPF